MQAELVALFASFLQDGPSFVLMDMSLRGRLPLSNSESYRARIGPAPAKRFGRL